MNTPYTAMNLEYQNQLGELIPPAQPNPILNPVVWVQIQNLGGTFDTDIPAGEFIFTGLVRIRFIALLYPQSPFELYSCMIVRYPILVFPNGD